MTLERVHQDMGNRLLAHGPLAALLQGGVHDREPAAAPVFPYIVLGETRELEGRVLNGCERKVFVSLHIWSDTVQREEAIQIERMVESALESGGYLFESFEILGIDEGRTHGVLVLRTYIERDGL